MIFQTCFLSFICLCCPCSFFLFCLKAPDYTHSVISASSFSAFLFLIRLFIEKRTVCRSLLVVSLSSFNLLQASLSPRETFHSVVLWRSGSKYWRMKTPRRRPTSIGKRQEKLEEMGLAVWSCSLKISSV